MMPISLGAILDSNSTEENSYFPDTLSQALHYFSSPARSVQFLASQRWPGGSVKCPVCGRTDVRRVSTRDVWECKTSHPGAQFSVKVGTIFEDTRIPVGLWMIALWRIANSTRKISSYQLARELGITEKSAWLMLRRVGLALQLKGVELPSLPGYGVQTPQN